MADHFYGNITIGGRLDADTAEALRKAINDQQIHGVMRTHFFESVGAMLDYARKQDGRLYFEDDQASGGQFDALEVFLQQHDIPYERYSDNYAEYDAERVYYAPGMEEPFQRLEDNDGYAMMIGPELRKVRNYIQNGEIDEALMLLKRHLEAFPEIPKFEVI